MADTDFFTDSEKLKPLPTTQLKKLIQQEASQKGHHRKQKLLDALTEIAVIAIYIIPLILAGIYFLILIYKAKTGQWNELETTIESMLIPVTTYLVGLLSKNVLIRNDND